MQTILYFVVMFTFSVANNDIVYVYKNLDDYNHRDTRTVQIPRLLFSFDYHDGDMLNVKIYSKNKPQYVNTHVYIKYAPGVSSVKKELQICHHIGRNDCGFKQPLNATEIFIELEFSSTKDWCIINQNIIKGSRVSPSLVRMNNSAYNICLTEDPCVIEVDLGNTYYCTHRVYRRRRRRRPIHDRTEKPDIHVENLNNNSATETNATTTDNTKVTIISSTIGAILVLIVIFVTIWTKRNCTGTPQIETTAPCEPFYVNALFRRECDQEIAEIEQHHYDEIGEHQSEQTENYYEEINS